MPTWLRPNGLTLRTTALFMAVSQAAMVFALWWVHPNGVIPNPTEVFTNLQSLLHDGLLFELSTSLLVNLEALILVTVVSLLISYLTVIPFFRPLATAISTCRNFGISGFVVVFTIFFGSGHWLRVALLSFCMVPFFVTSMVDVIETIPKEEWDDARILRMGPWRSVYEVVIRGKADKALDVLRQNASMGWMALTMVEGLSRSEGGIGVLMLNENKHFNLGAVFAVQVVIFTIGMLQDAGLSQLKKVLCPYASLSLERS